jgi:hypothetical protein
LHNYLFTILFSNGGQVARSRWVELVETKRWAYRDHTSGFLMPVGFDTAAIEQSCKNPSKPAAYSTNDLLFILKVLYKPKLQTAPHQPPK